MWGYVSEEFVFGDLFFPVLIIYSPKQLGRVCSAAFDLGEWCRFANDSPGHVALGSLKGWDPVPEPLHLPQSLSSCPIESITVSLSGRSHLHKPRDEEGCLFGSSESWILMALMLWQERLHLLRLKFVARPARSVEKIHTAGREERREAMSLLALCCGPSSSSLSLRLALFFPRFLLIRVKKPPQVSGAI